MEDFEILRPKIIKVGKRHYRKLAFEGSSTLDNNLYDLEYSAHDEYNDEQDCDSTVESTSDGYKTSMEVPVDLVKFICGKKMENKTNIERETNTWIKLPKFGVKEPVVITGGTRKAVTSCRHKIEIIIESSRQRLHPTHFISFPLYNTNIIKRFQEFKDTALQQCKKSKGFHESIFVIAEKLHLTISVMVLLTDSEVESTGKMLETCVNDIFSRSEIGQNPIRVKLVGLDYMNDDPSKVNVLYAKVEERDGSGRLQKLADEVQKYFVSNGIAKEERSKVKLHATVINTTLRDMNQSGDVSKTAINNKAVFNQRTSFDAREILEIFKDFEFGEHHLDCIHLSQRGVFDSNGHYHCCTSVSLS